MESFLIYKDKLSHYCALLYRRGLSGGSAGNASMRLEKNFISTPSGCSLNELTPENISVLNDEEQWISGNKPTKEIAFHLAWYRCNPDHNAIIHLHSPFATAYSCLADLKSDDALPPLTPYQIMKLGRVPVVPYAAPGSSLLTEYIADKARNAQVLFLSNHGFIAGGQNIESVVDIVEELESTCRLFFILRGSKMSCLSSEDVLALLESETRK